MNQPTDLDSLKSILLPLEDQVALAAAESERVFGEYEVLKALVASGRLSALSVITTAIALDPKLTGHQWGVLQERFKELYEEIINANT